MKSERVLLTRTPSSISILASILPYPLLSLFIPILFIPAILYFAAVVYDYPHHLVLCCCCLCLPRHLVFCRFCLCLYPPSCILLLCLCLSPPSCIFLLLSMFIPAILYFAAVVYAYPRHLVFCCCCLCLSPPSCILLLLSLRYTFKMSLSH